jgi:hypothetical protein
LHALAIEAEFHAATPGQYTPQKTQQLLVGVRVELGSIREQVTATELGGI